MDLAPGIYAANPDKLVEYGNKMRKKPGKVPPPTKTLAFKIDNDSDGEGFEIIMTARNDVADSYEWQKGQGAWSEHVGRLSNRAIENVLSMKSLGHRVT